MDIIVFILVSERCIEVLNLIKLGVDTQNKGFTYWVSGEKED